MLAKWMLTSVVVLGLGAPMWADDSDDGPGRGVARISVLNGDVSVRRGDSGDYVAAAINAPLVVQDNVYTGAGSKAELQFDWANMLRISSNAEVRLAELENRRYIVQIARGTVTWRVLRDQEAYVEISTPSVSVRPVKEGIYRVTVNEDGSSEITVRDGEAEVFTPRGSERLRSGKTMLARGTAADPEFRIVSEIREDEWDRWNEYRDRDLKNSRSYSYVSRDIYGAEDLDNHGRWVYVPPYGWVWSPHVAAGWAPYRYGRWSWIDWYGWSWVSYDPWGWAPYHYGRWFHNGPYGWCWWPGSYRARHYWSPALVAFFGFGGRGFGVGVGVGWGNVGWVPLAPYDPFHRWWGRRWYGGYRNRTYIDNSVTIVNNVNIRNTYRNARINNAVTVVDHDGFRRGRVTNVVRVSDADFSRATLARGPLPVTPDRGSLRLADRDTTFRPAEGRGAERFFSNRTPARVERVSFEDQRRGVDHLTRSAFGDDAGRGAERGVRTADASPARGTDAARVEGRGADRADRGARVAEANPPARSEDSQRGWRRVGEPVRGSSAVERQSEPTGRGSDGDWSRFGSARVGGSSDTGRGNDSSRFGEPAAAGRGEVRSGTGRADGNDGWVRFGGRGGSRVETNNDASDRGWRSGGRGADGDSRFGERVTGDDGWRRDISPRSESPRMDSNRSGSSRYESPRYDSPRSEPRMERRSQPSRGDSIRISPPIVRERGSSGSTFGGRSSSGGSVRSAPSGSFGGRGGSVRSAPSGSFGGGSMRGSSGGGGRISGGGGRVSSGGGGGSRGGGRGR